MRSALPSHTRVTSVTLEEEPPPVNAIGTGHLWMNAQVSRLFKTQKTKHYIAYNVRCQNSFSA